MKKATLHCAFVWYLLFISASKSSIRRFVITEKAPFTFKTLLRHYATHSAELKANSLSG